MALNSAWENEFGQKLEIYAGNNCIILQLPHSISADELLSLVTVQNIESLLRTQLEKSGFFGARFRENAGRALLVTQNKINQRMPLWMNRLRSLKLLNSVMKYEDFPILLETWRTCLQDEFDMDSLKMMLTEIESGFIKVSECRTTIPSPMVRNLSWRQINEYMYRSDEPLHGKTSRLRRDLLRDVVFRPDLRPSIPQAIVDTFIKKRQRLSPGYSPSSSRELVDWVKERLAIPQLEWENLLNAMQNDHDLKIDDICKSCSEKCVLVFPPAAKEPLIMALETASRIIQAFYKNNGNLFIKSLIQHADIPGTLEPGPLVTQEESDEILASILCEWLEFYGPISIDFICSTLGIEKQHALLALEDLIDSRKIISGQLITDGPDNDICDIENFEILLRINRAAAVPRFEPVGLQYLPLFLALFQGIAEPMNNNDHLYNCIEQLLCYPAPAELWESEFLPVRIKPYMQPLLDTVIQENELRWCGTGNKRIFLGFETDLDLIHSDPQTKNSSDIENPSYSSTESKGSDHENVSSLFPDTAARYDFSTLLRITQNSPAQLAERLWNGVWKGQITNDSFFLSSISRRSSSYFKCWSKNQFPE